MRRFVIAVLLLTATNLAAQDLESRVKALEDEVAELKRENAQLRKDLGLEVAARQPQVRPAGAESSLQIGGLIQAQGESGDRVDPRFPDDQPRVFLRRARLNAAGRFLDDFAFRTELDLAGSLGATSGPRAQLTDGFITWTRYAAANIRVGQFKTPFGFEQLYTDAKLYAIERSLVNDRLTLSRQIGVQLSGDVIPDRLNYAAGFFNGSGVNTTTNDNDHFLLVARVAGTPYTNRNLRVTAGLDGFTTRDNGSFNGRRTGSGADLQVAAGPFELWTEYLSSRSDPGTGDPLRASGWYAQGSWFAPGRRLQFVGKYDVFEALHTTTLGANYLIHADDLKLQVDWLKSEEGHRVLARLQTIF